MRGNVSDEQIDIVARGFTRAMTAAITALAAVPAFAHHSFAMYDQTKTVVLTGVVYRSLRRPVTLKSTCIWLAQTVPERGADGKPHAHGVKWRVLPPSPSRITAETMKSGTIISVKVNLLRDGSDFGSKVGNSGLAKCPWKTPPVPGMSCDTVQGRKSGPPPFSGTGGEPE